MIILNEPIQLIHNPDMKSNFELRYEFHFFEFIKWGYTLRLGWLDCVVQEKMPSQDPPWLLRAFLALDLPAHITYACISSVVNAPRIRYPQSYY